VSGDSNSEPDLKSTAACASADNEAKRMRRPVTRIKCLIARLQ
jgi:hypothetical protein